MPRTVLVPAVVIGLFGLAALGAIPHAAVNLATRHGLDEVLSACGLTWSVGWVISTGVGLIRRRESTRKGLVVAFTTLALMCVPFALFLIVIELARGVPNGGRTIVYFFFGMGVLALPAWSLSRPSAKAWFASPPRHRQMART